MTSVPEVRTIRPEPSSQTARVKGEVVNRAVYEWLCESLRWTLWTEHGTGDEVLRRPNAAVDLPVSRNRDGTLGRLEEPGGDQTKVGEGAADRECVPDGTRWGPRRTGVGQR